MRRAVPAWADPDASPAISDATLDWLYGQYEPWRDQAACAGLPLSWWFPSQVDDPSAPKARQVCAGCPVRVECAAAAIEGRITFGVWGGLGPGDRKWLPREVRERVLDRDPHALDDVA